MQDLALTGETSEADFAALVDRLAADPARRARLAELLREDHPLYAERGSAAVVRMRGWVLLALARTGLADAELLFVLEELDAGVDAYLVAAAARALRSCDRARNEFAPFVMRAITHVRYRDDPVSFDGYGAYAKMAGTTAVRELLTTLAWLGPRARSVLAEVESLRAGPGALPANLRPELDRAIEAIQKPEPAGDVCCDLPAGLGDVLSWVRGSRKRCDTIQETVFEDHDGASITFSEFFQGKPSIVVFFYVRCDNPLKCSLTVTKLGRVQKLLEQRGLAGDVRTAAVTYDPDHDRPDRLRAYGQNRNLRLDADNCMLRATSGGDALREHFQLGVNFVESLVNRHRIELYVLDAEGRIAASFARCHWDEEQVVERVVAVLNEGRARTPAVVRPTSAALGTLASLALAFFPKCPVCWAAYLSVFGITGLEKIPYSPWLQPLLALVILINLASVWLRCYATGRKAAFCLACAGALAILIAKLGLVGDWAAPLGVVLTLVGSLLGALERSPRRATNSGEASRQG